MEQIRTIHPGMLMQDKAESGCGECQTSCQSACKTSCTVGNQSCEQYGAEKKPDVA